MSRGNRDGKLLGKSLYVGNYYVTVQKKLGEGGFADIYQVVDRNDHSAFFALKHFRIGGDPEKLASVKRECLLMKSIKKHPNIVTLYAACFAGTPVATDGFFLMELCHQDLVKALTANHRHMTEADILRIFQQVALGLSYMHTQTPPVAHWDLKAENILQSLNGSWVVCDFGSATTMNEVVDPPRVAEVEDLVRRNTTAAYRAPEMYDLWSGNRINTQVDIFALGVLLYLMCFSQFPFQADDKLSVIRGKYPMPPSQHRPATRALIAQMLCVDPAQRPDIHAVVASIKSLLDGGIHVPAVASSAASHPAVPPPVPRPVSHPGAPNATNPALYTNVLPPAQSSAHVPYMHGHPNNGHPAHTPQHHHPQVAIPRSAQPLAHPAQPSPAPGTQSAPGGSLQQIPHCSPQLAVPQLPGAHSSSHPGSVPHYPPVAVSAAAASPVMAAPVVYGNMPNQQQQGVPHPQHQQQGVPHPQHQQQGVPHPQHQQQGAPHPQHQQNQHQQQQGVSQRAPPVAGGSFDPFTMDAGAAAQHSAAAYDPYAPPPPQPPAPPPDPFGQAARSATSVAVAPQAPPAVASASALPDIETGLPAAQAPVKRVAVPTRAAQVQPPPRTSSHSPPPGTAPAPPSTSTSTGTSNQQQDEAPKSHPLVKPTMSRPESPQRPAGAPPLPIQANPSDAEIQPAPVSGSMHAIAVSMKASAYAQDSSGASSTQAPPQVATRAVGALGRAVQGRSSAPGSPGVTAPGSPSTHARASSGAGFLPPPKRVSAAKYADSASQEAQSSEFVLPAAQPGMLAASNPRTNAQMASASASASAYAYAATGADSTDDDDAWGQPNAAEAAAAYVDNALMSHGTASTVPRVDSSAVAAIEETERELLQLRGQAKVAQEDKSRLEQKLGEVMSELDQRRLQVAELRSVVEALSKTGGSPKHAGSSSNGAGLARASQQDKEVSSPLVGSRNGAVSARVPAAMQSGGKGVVPARVVALLNETADAASRQGGLQRSVSEVHLDWEDIKEAPLRNDTWMP